MFAIDNASEPAVFVTSPVCAGSLAAGSAPVRLVVGSPVAFVSTRAEGVPRAGVTNVGEVTLAKFPVPDVPVNVAAPLANNGTPDCALMSAPKPPKFAASVGVETICPVVTALVKTPAVVSEAMRTFDPPYDVDVLKSVPADGSAKAMMLAVAGFTTRLPARSALIVAECATPPASVPVRESVCDA